MLITLQYFSVIINKSAFKSATYTLTLQPAGLWVGDVCCTTYTENHSLYTFFSVTGNN